MPYAILRTAKLKSAGEIGGSLAHTFRTRETPNADSSMTPFNRHIGATSADEVKAKIEARLPAKRRKDAVLCIEYFIGASPEAFDPTNPATGDNYFAAAMEWLKDRHGAENVISGHVHRDETSPHLVAYVVPRDGEKLNAKKFLGGKATLSAMQTDFAEKVGKPFRLERGLEGSKAVHTTVREFYANVNAAQAEAQKAALEADLDPSIRVLEKTFFTTRTETPQAAMDRVVTAARKQLLEVEKQVQKLEIEKKSLENDRKRMLAERKEMREQFGEILDLLRKLPHEQLVNVVAYVKEMIEAAAKVAQMLKVEKQKTLKPPRRNRDRGGFGFGD